MEKGQQESFADFMTGSFDANYLVNPNARGHVQKAYKTASSFGKGLKLGAGLIDKKDIESKQMASFGNGDLNHLEQRGRFPGIDVDHFEFEGDSDNE